MKGIERKRRESFLITWYQSCGKLFNINEPIIAISARKNTPLIRHITKLWLEKNYPNVVSFYLLNNSRTIENVINFKSCIINQENITEHYEDNMKILKGIRKNVSPNVKLFYWEKTMDSPKEIR